MENEFSRQEMRSIIKQHKQVFADLEYAASLSEKLKEAANENIYSGIKLVNAYDDRLQHELAGDDHDKPLMQSELDLLKNVVYYRLTKNFSDDGKDLLAVYEPQIREPLLFADKETKSLRWLFLSKEKKATINNVISSLYDLWNSPYQQNVQDVTDKIHHCLSEYTDDQIIQLVDKDKEAYLETLRQMISSPSQYIGTAKTIESLFSDYQSHRLEIDNLDQFLESEKPTITESIEHLVGREAYRLIKDIPVEELKRKKQGIKVGALRASGYNNIASIYSASTWRIASVRGISEDAAREIKALAIRKYDNYARLCQAVLEEINADQELAEMQQKQVDADTNCYTDPQFHLLAQTIIYVGSWITDDNDLNNVPKGSAIADEDIKTTHYWIYAPGDGAAIWDECYDKGIMAIGWDALGDLRSYASKEEMKEALREELEPGKSYKNDAHATWQFVHDMNPGDIVFAKKGMHLVIGRGVVESEYQYDATREVYKNTRKVQWTHRGKWQHPGQAVMKTLTDITPYSDYVEKMNALFESDTGENEEPIMEYPAYGPEDFTDEVFMDDESYKTLVSLVRTKKNVILQGAPGVGKTYAAKRLAYSMMGVKDPNRVTLIQFHQSYSYEDFIMGFRPSENGFELKHGVFYNFCKNAEVDSDNEYFFIIDEINRGNLSKIFGELFMLIENDKRGIELQLLYSNEKFSIPSNVYIIGMMNTADRSLAMLDYALRRRFAFFEMKPGFETDGFREYQKNLENDAFNKLIGCVERLNEKIASDESLGEGFCIGHSYFSNLKKVTPQILSNIVEFELIPLIKEYWFDEPAKVKECSNDLRSAIK